MLPLYFLENVGQWDSMVAYAMVGSQVAITKRGSVIINNSIEIDFGGKPSTIEGDIIDAGQVHYYGSNLAINNIPT